MHRLEGIDPSPSDLHPAHPLPQTANPSTTLNPTMSQAVTPTPAPAAPSPLIIESPSLRQAYNQDDIKDFDVTNAYLAKALQQESLLYLPCEDYLGGRIGVIGPMADTEPVSEGWRRKLAEWCYEVVDHFKFDREAVAYAMSYLDRSVSKKTTEHGTPILKREFQLFAVTSLYMAIKIHGETDKQEGPRRKLKIEAFFELSRKQFDVELIEETERHILDSLNWNVNPPTVLKFVTTYLFLCPKWPATTRATSHATVMSGIYDVARYIAELTTCQSAYAFTYKTSVVAYAAVLVAIESVAAKFPVPYDARVRLLNNIAMGSGLGPSDPEVRTVYELLKKISPTLFSNDEIPAILCENDDASADTSTHGKTSPVCVVDAPDATTGANRKRSRAATDESWRPIQNAM